MDFTITPTGDHVSSCRRFRVYPTPDGYVALDFSTRPPVISDAYCSFTSAAAWCGLRLPAPVPALLPSEARADA